MTGQTGGMTDLVLVRLPDYVAGRVRTSLCPLRACRTGTITDCRVVRVVCYNSTACERQFGLGSGRLYRVSTLNLQDLCDSYFSSHSASTCVRAYTLQASISARLDVVTRTHTCIIRHYTSSSIAHQSVPAIIWRFIDA